jgi:hypothetical protein
MSELKLRPPKEKRTDTYMDISDQRPETRRETQDLPSKYEGGAPGVAIRL